MRSVAILGFGPTRDKAPSFDDPKWEFWGMAHDQDWPSFHRIFEMHERSLWERLHGRPEAEHVTDLTDMWQPLFMRYQYHDVPLALAYPMAEVCARLEPPQSSIAAIMSAAILEGAQRIGVWGVDMGVGSEYAYQRANMRFLLGFCKAYGIEVMLPDAEKLTDGSEPYGSEAWFAARNFDERRATTDEVEEIRAQLLKAAEWISEGAVQQAPGTPVWSGKGYY